MEELGGMIKGPRVWWNFPLMNKYYKEPNHWVSRQVGKRKSKCNRKEQLFWTVGVREAGTM